jgi:hypothetical protein
MNDFVVPKHSVIQYIRNNKRIPYGVVVGVKTPEGLGFALGYSLCNKKDRFNKKMALKIALGRATFNGCKTTEVNEPRDIRKVMPVFFERCKKYYKVSDARSIIRCLNDRSSKNSRGNRT